MSEIRAELTIDRPLSQCCDAIGKRYALSAVHVAPSSESGMVWASACDSKILAVVKQPGMTDVPHLLPGQFAKPAGKGKTVASLNGVWTVSGKNARGVDDGKPARIAAETEGRFPATEHVLPAVDSGCTVLSLDAELLANLAKAISDDGKVFLLIKSPEDSIAVSGSHGIGVIMPASIASQNQTHEQAAVRVRDAYNEQRDAYCADLIAAKSGKVAAPPVAEATPDAMPEPAVEPESDSTPEPIQAVEVAPTVPAVAVAVAVPF